MILSLFNFGRTQYTSFIAFFSRISPLKLGLSLFIAFTKCFLSLSKLKSSWHLAIFDNIIIGGGKIPTRLERWLAEQGIRAFSTYGMTETCSHVALAPMGTTPQPYTAIGDITFTTDDRGCLVIHSPHFSLNKIITNDIVDLISSTQFLWRGRIDNVINTGGIKVFPEEIEPKISELLPNVRFYITSQQSDKWGEELTLILEYKSLPEGIIKKGDISPYLIEKLKQKLPAYAIPRHYIAVGKFNETSTGKIIRKI